MFNGYGSGTNFSISDYAPVDPLSGIPGFGAQQAQQQNAPQQGQQQNRQPNPSAAGIAANISQSTAGRSVNQVQQEAGRRHLSTEEYRRDFERAPVYVPTPIPGTSTNAGSSASQPHQFAAPPQQHPPGNYGQAAPVPDFNRAQGTQQQPQNIPNGQQQPNADDRRRNRSPARHQPPHGSRQPHQPSSSSVPPNAHRQAAPVQNVPNMAFNVSQPNAPMMFAPPPQAPNQPMNQYELIHRNPDIRVFRDGHPNFNTHVCVNHETLTLQQFLDFQTRQNLKISDEAHFAIRRRLPSTHPMFLTPQAVRKIQKAMAQKQQKNANMPQQPGNIAPLPARPNMHAQRPPQHAHQQIMPPNHQFAPGIVPHIPSGGHHRPAPQGTPQMSPHFQQQQYHLNRAVMTPEQIQQQQQQMHRYFQLHLQHQQQQQMMQGRQQPPPTQNNIPVTTAHQQRQPAIESGRNAPVQPMASEPHATEHPPHHAEQRPPQPPTVPSSSGQPTEGTDRPEPDIAADESPPPCAYTPLQESAPAFDPEQVIDLKPTVVAPQAEKANKNKKKIITITLDDDEPPQNVRIKREVPERENSPLPQRVSNAPSTSSSTVAATNIKIEPTDAASNNQEDGRPESNNQQNKTVPASSIKQDPGRDANNSSSNETALQLSGEEVARRLIALEQKNQEKAETEEAYKKKSEELAKDRERLEQEKESIRNERERLRIKEERLRIEKERVKIEQEREKAQIEKEKRELAEAREQQKAAAKIKEEEETEKAEQKSTVQEQQVSTSQSAVKNSASRSSSPGSDIFTLKRKKRVVEESEDEDDDEERNRRKATRSHDKSTNKRNVREKKRPVASDDSDDEMPVSRKKRRGNKHSDDEDEEWRGASDADSSDDEDFIDDGESDDRDSMKDFIVDDEEEVEDNTVEDDDDDDEIIYAEDEFVQGLERRIEAENRRRRNPENRSETPTGRRRRDPSPKHKAIRSKPPARESDRKRSNEPVSTTPTKPVTSANRSEEKRKAAWKTREDNREKARLANLEKQSSVTFCISRPTRAHDASGKDPLDDEISFAATALRETKKNQNNSQNTPRKDLQKEAPAQVNKRTAASVSENIEDYDDSVHIPAKRMAHSSSVPGPSKPRQLPSSSAHVRPSQDQMLAKRNREFEEKKKKDKEEYEKLKSKKYLTGEEQGRFKQLQKSLGIGQIAARPTSTSNPSTSSNFNKVRVKTEPGISPVKKPPPPPILNPEKGRTFTAYRKKVVELLFIELLDSGVPQAGEKAQKMELELLEKSQTLNKYKAHSSHKVQELRRKSNSGVQIVNQNAVSHEQILTGHVKDNCSVLKGKKHVEYRSLPTEQLYRHLIPLKLTDAELEKEAYPLFKNNNRVATIAETQYTLNKKVFLKDADLERTCSRCNKEFRLKPDGSMVREKDICRYHNRGVAKEGKRDTFRKRYHCCNEEFNVAPGCKFSDVHVFDQLYERELKRFVSTPPSLGPADGRNMKVYAIDCEMVYTVWGPALARLSMVDMRGKKVLDVFIKPPTEVLDPNTEFSGLTMEQIQNATDTLETAHHKLFKFVNAETILIGHSLESDLKAMRLVHKSVVDTAILFKSPGDYKIALKILSSKLLGKTIQGDNEDAVGHDSFEDALTCVDLIYYGLKNPESLVKKLA